MVGRDSKQGQQGGLGISLGCGCAFPASKVASGMGSSPSKFIPQGARGAWEGDLGELWEELGSIPAGSGCCQLPPRCVSVRMRSLRSIHRPPSVLEFPWESPWEPVLTLGCLSPPREVSQTCWSVIKNFHQWQFWHNQVLAQSFPILSLLIPKLLAFF